MCEFLCVLFRSNKIYSNITKQLGDCHFEISVLCNRIAFKYQITNFSI